MAMQTQHGPFGLPLNVTCQAQAHTHSGVTQPAQAINPVMYTRAPSCRHSFLVAVRFHTQSLRSPSSVVLCLFRHWHSVSTSIRTLVLQTMDRPLVNSTVGPLHLQSRKQSRTQHVDRSCQYAKVNWSFSEVKMASSRDGERQT